MRRHVLLEMKQHWQATCVKHSVSDLRMVSVLIPRRDGLGLQQPAKAGIQADR